MIIMPRSTRRSIVSLAKEIDRDLRVIRQIQRQPTDAAIASGGLTGPQQSAMSILVRSAGMSLKELSKELWLAHSTVSGIVDRLEKQGLVKRQSDEADLRFSKVVVTGEVRDFLRDTWPSLEMHPLAEALRSATPAERQQILDGVGALRRILERRNYSGS
jgi:DNA-binding MarR family transcriptional regulator